MFRFAGDLQSHYIKTLFTHFWSIAKKVSNPVFVNLLQKELFAISIQQLLCSYSTEKLTIMNEFFEKANSILLVNEMNPKEQMQERKLILKRFIIAILDIEFLPKMVEYGLNIVFCLLVFVIDEIDSNVVMSFLIQLISLIVKDHHSITYETTRAKAMSKFNIMFFFINYISKTKDFNFSSLTIKYVQLIEFIINCSNACRSPYEKDNDKESTAYSTRFSKQADEKFLHFNSIEYLSPTAKQLIGLIQLKNQEQSKSTQKVDDNKDESTPFAAVVEEEEEYNDIYDDQLFGVAIDEKEEASKNKQQTPPISQITMDFIYLISFFSMNYQPFFDYIMNFFNESVNKKKKKKGKSSSLLEAIRAWTFLIFHTIRLEIASTRLSEESKSNPNEKIGVYYSKLDQYLTTVLTFARSCSQKALSIVLDFISALIIELKVKLEPKEIREFDLNLTSNDDELMLSFLVTFARNQTIRKFRIDSISSSSIAKFYSIAFKEMNTENVKNIFGLVISSLGDRNSVHDMRPLFQKMWLIMRRRPDMLSIFRDIFYEENEERDQDNQIKRDFLESMLMHGLANLLFGKVKDNANMENYNDNEEEEKIDNDDADIFDNYKDDVYNESDEEYEEILRTQYQYIDDFTSDDSSSNDESDSNIRQ